MKRCPKCNIEYFDTTLEFCLEDGSRLVAVPARETESPTVIRSTKTNSAAEKTINFSFPDPAEASEFSGAKPVETTAQKTLIKDKVAEQTNSVFEMAPFVVALAHNWWQWIYLNNQYYSSFSNYFLSANFLMWLLLLMAGAVASLLAIKRCQNKAFAFASLIILSINLILILVPKR